MSQAEDTLAFQLVSVGISFEREFRFHPVRKWRADFLVEGNLIVEVDGATRGNPGRHQRVDGVDYDCERQAEALCQGYAYMRVSARMARDGRALEYIERLLGLDGEEQVSGDTKPVAVGRQGFVCAAEE